MEGFIEHPVFDGQECAGPCQVKPSGHVSEALHSRLGRPESKRTGHPGWASYLSYRVDVATTTFRYHQAYATRHVPIPFGVRLTVAISERVHVG